MFSMIYAECHKAFIAPNRILTGLACCCFDGYRV
jgi:hypothetical protein